MGRVQLRISKQLARLLSLKKTHFERISGSLQTTGKLAWRRGRVRDARLFLLSLPPKPKVAHSIKINASECTPKPKTDGRTDADPVGRAVGHRRRRLRWRQSSSRPLARSTAMPFLLRLKSLKGEMGKKGGKATRLALPLSNMNREERGRVITCPQLRPARGNTAGPHVTHNKGS